MLDFNSGLHHEAARHAQVAVPLLERLHADDDATSMRVSIALTALHDGDLDEAERILDAVGEPEAKDVTGGMVAREVRAEILLARGETDVALRLWRDNVEAMRSLRFPGMESGGDEPWSVVALGTALTAHVRFAETPDQQRATRDLAAPDGRDGRAGGDRLRGRPRLPRHRDRAGRARGLAADRRRGRPRGPGRACWPWRGRSATTAGSR